MSQTAVAPSTWIFLGSAVIALPFSVPLALILGGLSLLSAGTNRKKRYELWLHDSSQGNMCFIVDTVRRPTWSAEMLAKSKLFVFIGAYDSVAEAESDSAAICGPDTYIEISMDEKQPRITYVT